MNIVVLVDPDAGGVDIRGALRGVGLNELTTATTWDTLMQSVVGSRPDLVVLTWHVLAAQGEAATKAADWALRPLGIPVLIALGRDESDQRYAIEMSTEFEYFIIEPFELQHVSDIITDALGHTRWQTVTREVSVVEELTFEVQADALDEAFENMFDSAAPPVVEPATDAEPNATTPFAFEDDGLPDEVESERVPDPRTAPAASSLEAGYAPEASGVDRAGTSTDSPSQMTDSQPATSTSRPDRPRVAIATPVVGAAAPSAPGKPAQAPDAREVRTTERVDVTTTRVLKPDPAAGELGVWRVPHVLAVLAEQRSTGTLRLTRERVRREIAIFDGRPGARDARSTMMDRSRLLSTFAWTSGTWVFVPDGGVARTSFIPYAGGFEFIWEGITRNLSMNDAAALLTPHLKSYAVHTDRIALLSSHADLQKVRDLLLGFVGDAPFERQMMQLGVPPDEVLRAAWFGMIIGAVAFFDEATSPPVSAHVEVVRATASASYASIDGDISSPGSSSPGTRSGASPAVDPAVAEAIDTLTGTWDELSAKGAFELFGLDAGDDESRLTERYYEMVREYHPDRYARINDPQVRALAEQIFLHIRAQYARARAGETGPRRAVGPGAQARSPADQPRSTAPASDAQQPAAAPSAPSSVASQRAPAPAGASAARPPISDRVQRRTPGTRRPVSQVLADLRRKRASGSTPTVGPSTPSTSAPGESGSFSRESEGPSTNRNRRSTGSRNLSPDQLLRNAVKALESGATDKAADHLSLGRTRGGAGPMYDGIEEYVGYVREERTARHVLKRLRDLSQDAERDWQKSVLLLFLGHVHRLEEDDAAALKAYGKARSLDEANLSAQRWERHVKKRSGKKASGKPQGFLDKLMNTKITLGKPK